MFLPKKKVLLNPSYKAIKEQICSYECLLANVFAPNAPIRSVQTIGHASKTFLVNGSLGLPCNAFTPQCANTPFNQYDTFTLLKILVTVSYYLSRPQCWTPQAIPVKPYGPPEWGRTSFPRTCAQR